MKKIDIQDFVPVGIDFRQMEGHWITGGLLVCGAWSLITPIQYFDLRQQVLQSLKNHGPVLRMVPFSELSRLGISIFPLFFLAMLLLGLTHMHIHHRQSMSVYLMKRLPNPWEYQIRCWTVPLLAILAAAIELALLYGLYYLIYLKCTPIECLLFMYQT